VALDTMRVFRSANPDADVDLHLVRNKPALGVVGNFEAAIRACRFELVALADQDDVWVHDRLELIVEIFEDDPRVVLVSTDARLVGATGAPIGDSLFGALRVSSWELAAVNGPTPLDALIRRNLITGATTVFRRELLDSALPIPEGWIHDEWLGSIAASVGRVHVDRRRLIDYRQHSTNQIGVSRPTVRRNLDRLREPRRERNATLFRRAVELVSRLEGLGPAIDSRTLTLARQKLDHERRRSGLPTRRRDRIWPVLGSLLRGDYRRYGMGARDALRDVLQPVE